jgi:hypothetical protein
MLSGIDAINPLPVINQACTGPKDAASRIFGLADKVAVGGG